MTSPAHDVDVRRGEHHDISASLPKDKEVEPRKIDEDAAWANVERALKGEHVDELPKFVALSSRPHLHIVAERIADIAKVASGDDVLAIGELFRGPFDETFFESTVAAAMVATIDVSLPQLRRAIVAARDPGMLGQATFAKVRSRFGGARLFEALPGLARTRNILLFLLTHDGFRKWFFESPGPVIAELMSRSGSRDLASTLDEDVAVRWHWIEDIRIGGASNELSELEAGTKNAGVKQRLKAKLGPIAGMTSEARQQFHAAHSQDPAAELASGTSSRDMIFDAIARAGGLHDAADRAQLIKELKRLHAGVDDIIAATYRAGIVDVAALELVLAAPDVTAQHIVTFLAGRTDPTALFAAKDQRLLREVRKRVPSLQLADLGSFDSLHDSIVANEGLRNWFFEAATATELLEFCTGNAAKAPAAIRLVAARHPDWAWVLELTGAEKPQQLRALALQCNRPATAQYIRSTLLGDGRAFSDGKVEEGVTAVDPRSKQGADTRLQDALDHGTARDVMERLIDLDEHARSTLGHNDATAKAIAFGVTDADFPRAAYLLDLTFRQTLAFCPSHGAATVGVQVLEYLRSRPPAEELAALAHADFAAVARNVSPNLLVVFPSLAQPQQLAKSLQQTPALLGLLLGGSDLNVVAGLVAREPVLSVATPILDGDPTLYSKLPTLKHMSKTGQEAIKRLEKSASSESDVPIQVQEIEDDQQHGAENVRKEGRKFHAADKLATLPEAIDQLAKMQGSEVSALALLESHRAQVPALLADATLGSHVRTLAKLISLPPHIAIPYLAPQQLIEMPNSRGWYYGLSNATVLLHLLAKPHSRGLVAGNLTAGNAGAHEWLARLPRGRNLTDEEAHTLDALHPFLHNADVLRDLFLARFGVAAPAEYDVRTVDLLYQTSMRVPRGHVDQGVVRQITRKHLDGADAQWSAPDIELGDNLEAGKKYTTPDSPDRGWYTRDQLRAHYGYDDAAIKAQLAANRLESRTEKGVEQLRVKQQTTEKLAAVLLHEIGHSVDDILGNKTQPVFGFAKWRAYDAGEFDLWATEMGGWNKVKEADKPKIRQAWLDSMRSDTVVRDLVAPDHPALSKEYESAGVQVVQLALHQVYPAYTKRVIVGDRVFTANKAYFGGFYSLQADAALSAPSEFSLYAPQEYFAECYVEYYREVDGTPGSRDKRGGALPAPVKQWFDANVDALKHDPHRFGDPAPKDAAPNPNPKGDTKTG